MFQWDKIGKKGEEGQENEKKNKVEDEQIEEK